MWRWVGNGLCMVSYYYCFLCVLCVLWLVFVVCVWVGFVLQSNTTRSDNKHTTMNNTNNNNNTQTPYCTNHKKLQNTTNNNNIHSPHTPTQKPNKKKTGKLPWKPSDNSIIPLQNIPIPSVLMQLNSRRINKTINLQVLLLLIDWSVIVCIIIQYTALIYMYVYNCCIIHVYLLNSPKVMITINFDLYHINHNIMTTHTHTHPAIRPRSLPLLHQRDVKIAVSALCQIRCWDGVCGETYM